MSKARANIINALHALENGKPAAEVNAWLQDAIDELKPVGRGVRQEHKPVIEGYEVTQRGRVVLVSYLHGDEFARCVTYPDRVTVHMRDRKYPVDVRNMDAAIDYIKMVNNLK